MWTAIRFPTKHELRGVWCDGAGVVVVVGNDGVFRSTDDGATWASVPTGVKSYVLDIRGRADSLFAVTGGGNVLRLTNGGASWKKDKTPLARVLYGVTSGDARVDAWLARDDAWSKRAAELSQLWLAADGTLWGLGKDEIASSRDGATWETLSLPAYSRATRGCSATDAVLLGTERGVQRSIDRGATWTGVVGPWDTVALWSDGAQRVFASIRHEGVHESRDAGATWKKIANHHAVAGCIAGDRVVYITTDTLYTTPALAAATIDTRAPAPAAAAASDDELLLDRLLARWRETRSTALAARIDALSVRAGAHLPELAGDEAWHERAAAKRCGDLAQLLATFTRAPSRYYIDKRLAVLATWPADPRIAAMIASLFATPQWTGDHAKRFWTMAGEILVATGDRRALPVLDRVDTTRDRSYLSGWLARNLPKIRARLDATPVVELSGAELAAIDRDLGAPVDRTPATLLAEIYANPDDDATRLVYADAVGGERGELIVAQIQGGDRKRIAALLDKHARTWLGAIEPAVLPGGMVFARGFLSECRAKATERVATQMLGKPEWSTVRAIDVANWDSETWIELVRGMPALRELTGAGAEILAGAPLPYTRLGLGRRASGRRDELIAPLTKTKNLPHLRSLVLHGNWGAPSALAKLWPSKPQLDHVEHATHELAAWFEHLAAVPQIARFDLLDLADRRNAWSFAAQREGTRFAVDARCHPVTKYSDPAEQLWEQLSRMTPARLARLTITKFDFAPLATKFATRFPDTELAISRSASVRGGA